MPKRTIRHQRKGLLFFIRALSDLAASSELALLLQLFFIIFTILPSHPVFRVFVVLKSISLFFSMFLHNDKFLFFFLNDTAPPEISPLPLHDALPIYCRRRSVSRRWRPAASGGRGRDPYGRLTKSKEGQSLAYRHASADLLAPPAAPLWSMGT